LSDPSTPSAFKGKALFVINKFAGGNYQSNLERIISTLCEAHDIDFNIAVTMSKGHAIDLALNAVKEKFSSVIAVGGDGTINEVAQGLFGSQVALGIVPRGSGNGLARHLGISLDPVEAISDLFTSHAVDIDTFTVNGKLSLNVSGIGFDGHITNLFGAKGQRGLLGYVALSVKEFLGYPEITATISWDENQIDRQAFIVAIANSSQYGNNARIAPLASVRDGLLHINIVKKIPFYRIDFLYSIFSGTANESSFCEILEVQSAKIVTSKPVRLHIDGEPYEMQDTFIIKIRPQSMPVLLSNTLRKI
jgi:YegS/Rv2252/BmrU family lipid kinase